MTMRVMRVNESSSRLARVLRGYLFAEFWRKVDRLYGDDCRQWPPEVIEDLLLAATSWRQEIGRIEPVARTFACIAHEGETFCVLQIQYARVKHQESVSPEAIRGASSGIGGTDGGSRGGPCRPVAAAAPASLREPSENPDAAWVRP